MAMQNSEHDAHVEAAETALNSLTTAAANHDDPPDEHIHRPAAAEHSHSWIRRWIPETVQQEYEVYYHMGNYVIERSTGKKSFEDMSHLCTPRHAFSILWLLSAKVLVVCACRTIAEGSKREDGRCL